MQTHPPTVDDRASVSIVFSPPEGDSLEHHKRTLEGIPRPIAEAIVDDYRAYGEPGTDTSPYQLYRYDAGGEERQIALDYTEVVDLSKKLRDPESDE